MRKCKEIKYERDISGDIKFGDPLVQKFVNKLMHDGKKYVAYKIFYSVIDNLSEIVNNDSITINFDVDYVVSRLYANFDSDDIDIENIKKELSKNSGLQMFIIALLNVIPLYEIKRRRVGAQTLPIPSQIDLSKGTRIGMSWIISCARKGSYNEMVDKLTNEIFSAYKKEGLAYKKKEENEKFVSANSFFSTLKF